MPKDRHKVSRHGTKMHKMLRIVSGNHVDLPDTSGKAIVTLLSKLVELRLIKYSRQTFKYSLTPRGERRLYLLDELEKEVNKDEQDDDAVRV